MEPKKTGKRIVSKGEYLGRVSKKTGGYSIGAGLCLLCLLGVLTVCLASLQTDVSPRWRSSDVAATLVVGTASFIAGYLGWRTIKKAQQVDVGVPLTRTTAADLPAEDILVRASEEPTPEQQAVLLRAASQGQETPAEELVRPTIGP